MMITLGCVLLLAMTSWSVTPNVTATGGVTGTGNGLAHARIFQGTVTITGQGTLHYAVGATVKMTSGTIGDQYFTEKRPRGNKHNDSFMHYKNFNGTAVITGEDVHIFFRGNGLTLTAAGAGRAHFVGTGTFTTQPQSSGYNTGQWAARPKTKSGHTDKWWESIRIVYGVYTFKHAKDATGSESAPSFAL
jgi:hypothetical protein